jgi:hypothetical protein
LTGGTKITLVAVPEKEKHQLPEAPISITVKAIYKGYEVLITKRSDENSVISLAPGIVLLVDKLVELGFEPSRATYQSGSLPHPETKETGKENPVPICGIHQTAMLWREGDNKQSGKHYAFWACPEKNPDGSFCKYKPQKG